MSDNQQSEQTKNPQVETNIIFEAPRKSFAQSVIVWFARLIVSVVLLIALAFIFLNFIPEGEMMKDRYERKCRNTYESLEDGVKFCRFYASHFGHPPTTKDEIRNFNNDRMRRLGLSYRLPDGSTLPFWNARDGFGHDIDIQVDSQKRKILLKSRGFLPFTGDIPGFLNLVKETTY